MKSPTHRFTTTPILPPDYFAIITYPTECVQYLHSERALRRSGPDHVTAAALVRLMTSSQRDRPPWRFARAGVRLWLRGPARKCSGHAAAVRSRLTADAEG